MTKTMLLTPRHLAALVTAESLLFHCDYCQYLELKSLLADDSEFARTRFKVLFTKFYQMTPGRLTTKFEDRFFEILFNGPVLVNGKPVLAPILMELYDIKRAKGDNAMQFSFVSKLAGMRLESSPIFDIHVAAFFNQKCPAASKGHACRIEWYLSFLDHIRDSYIAWSKLPTIAAVLEKFRLRDTRLQECHVVRLLDFLVWKVGNEKLLGEQANQNQEPND